MKLVYHHLTDDFTTLHLQCLIIHYIVSTCIYFNLWESGQ